jgi:enoyl-CoA hydratase/carnithine racemase
MNEAPPDLLQVEAGEAPLVLERRGRVGVIRLNRPDRRNVLTLELRDAIGDAIESLDRDDGVGCIVLAGSETVFAAGADIRSLRDQSLAEAIASPATRIWARIASCGTPIVAAVAGYALGGGCELALACDMIVASETAIFGQPEIALGIIPGGGATQRIARVLGKQRAIELILTGRRFDAAEAERMGIVNRVVPAGTEVEAAVELAAAVAAGPPLAVRLAKQAVLGAEEMPLTAALQNERRLYEIAMATADRREGMTAFLEKRPPQFKGC